MAIAQEALARDVVSLFEREQALPEPTPFEKIVIPKSCDLVTLFALGVDPPDPSERVNVYLPKSLLARADRRAAELGMSRSSFFGFAVTNALSGILGTGSFRMGLSEPRSKARKTGRLRTERSSTKSPRRNREP